VATYSLAAANTWQFVTITIPGDTGGTWLKTNGQGIALTFDLGSGSTLNTTAGSWQAGAFTRTSGCVNWTVNAGATFYITGVQLEAGTVATNFERRDFGRELIMCQRYYEKSFSQNTAPANGASATTLATAEGAVTGLSQNRLVCGPTVFFKVVKRATPTVSKFGNSSADWIYGLQSSTAYLGGANSGMQSISDSSFVAQQNIVDAAAICVAGHWTASAEL
jgi:hypothetical protein